MEDGAPRDITIYLLSDKQIKGTKHGQMVRAPSGTAGVESRG